MRSRQLETALTEFIEAAASHLRAEVASGAEVPFELGSRAGRRGRATPLYCYRALTGAFIAEREAALKRLPGHAEAAKLLEGFDGLDRYLASAGTDVREPKGRVRVHATIKALLEDVFEEQTDFELRPERLRAALERLEQSAFASTSAVTLVATLHGLTIASAELPLTKGLTIAQPDALRGAPEGAVSTGEGERTDNHLIVVLAVEDDDPPDGMLRGRELLKDLLRALRLFGDGRVTLGALAWARVGAGAWNPLALGAGGRPHGMLVVTVEQEDELRAFCSLVSRRAPHGNELAWALRRFELGCERESPYEALSDYLLALRVLLEPEGPSSGLLAGRLAALCATPEHRVELTERIVQALALERAAIAGTSVKQARRSESGRTTAKRGDQVLVEEVADHLRALLRDVICGHLVPDLAALADELLAAPDDAEEDTSEAEEDTSAEEAPVLIEAP
jgi:hypothetical protein